MKGALIGSIYKKSLTVDLSASKESVGKLNNLISVDVSEIQSFCCYSHYMWSTVVELSTATTLLFIVVRVLFIHTFIDTYIHIYIHTYTHISTTGYDCISCIPNFLVHNYALKYIQYININTYINVHTYIHTYILYIQKKITIVVHMICLLTCMMMCAINIKVGKAAAVGLVVMFLSLVIAALIGRKEQVLQGQYFNYYHPDENTISTCKALKLLFYCFTQLLPPLLLPQQLLPSPY